MKILADINIPFVENYFKHAGELILKPGRLISHQDVVDVDLLLVRSITTVNKTLLKNSKVKFVGSVTAGSDHLDTDYLDQAGIAWSVAEGFNAPPVSDYVVSVVASLMQKKIILSTQRLKAAVIGVGNVGKLVADRLSQLNFEVLLCDPLRSQHEENFISTPLSQLKDLDLISIHVPLSKTGLHPTYHLINRSFLENQKEKTVLLNASRGVVINESDLKLAGRHLIWCLDVFQNEPQIDQAILESACIATPHIAGYSVQSKYRGIAMLYQVAVRKKFIPAMDLADPVMPYQTLSFSNQKINWQDGVLKVFDPLLLTQALKNQPDRFDEMRNGFSGRNEFSFTKLREVNCDLEDRLLLKQLGFEIISKEF